MSKLMIRTIETNHLGATKYEKVKVKMLMDCSFYSKGDIGILRRNKTTPYVYNFRINGKTTYTDDLMLNQVEILEAL